MALLCPNEGEDRLLLELLDGGTTRENWTFKLYTSATTPAETDTAATYTECSFTGYSAQTLTRTVGASTWQTISHGTTLETQDAKSVYGSSALSYSATSAQAVNGYFIVGVTSTKLIFAEKFASTINLVNPSTLTIQPAVEMA